MSQTSSFHLKYFIPLFLLLHFPTFAIYASQAMKADLGSVVDDALILRVANKSNDSGVNPISTGTGTLSRKILNKNMVNGACVLTQSMLNDSNTIYVIQNDYILGSDITLPANCLLEFSGGSISPKGNNDNIEGKNTGIIAGVTKIFDSKIKLSGTWNVPESYPEWFGAKSDSSFDSAPAIQSCINSFKRVLLSGTYRSGHTLYLSMGTELMGKGLYISNIKFDKNVSVGVSQYPNTNTLRGVTLKDLVLSKEEKTKNSSGICFNSASQICLENVTISRFTYGYDLNSYYVSTIRKCNASLCDVGFYFGKNDGNSTSTTMESCYALKCDVGYVLKRLNYSTLTACACDESRIAYDFWHSNVTLFNCGCELIGERIISLDMHSEDDVLLNKCGNIVSINDFQAIECQGSVPPILISAGTRLADDRNIVSINGLYLGVNKEARIDKLIQYSGDTQLYLSRISTPYGKIPLFENASKGVPFNAYACSQIYIEGKRYVALPLLEKVVKSRVGEVAYVHMNNTFVECYWNGVKWVDNKGFSIGMHKGKKSLRPKGRAAGDSSLHILDANDIGYEYYDTSINKLIYVKSVDSKGMVIWVDAMGNVLPS
jgi:hypothetical protein